MTLQSSETRLLPPTPRPLDEGPVLECAPHGTELADQTLRIRARRLLPFAREDVYAAWTRRTAWDSWMRLRARSRASLAAYRGGAFRLELAEGPTIHVITGTVADIRPCESVSLTWVHQNSADSGSTIDVTFRQLQGETELTLLHRGIGSRREAAWLMRLWTTVLDRLADYLGETPRARRTRDITARIPTSAEPEAQRPTTVGRFVRTAGLVLGVLSLTQGTARAQPAPDTAQAATYFASAKWTEAADAYGKLARRDTANIVNWYRYGVALEEIGRYNDAVAALRHALRAQPPLVNQVRYRLAKAHAGLGARDSVVANLDSAASGGFRLWETVKDDADFTAMHNDARFTRTLARIEANRFPCRHQPENRQLDYWVGDWRVVNGNTLLGTNKVELVNGDCTVQENWMSAGAGGGGKSWSYYEPSVGKWKQVFIFDGGAVWEYTGELQGGVMQFERPLPATANTPAGIERMSYFPIAKDSVRQLIEHSTDGGKAWTAVFDGMYVRKPGAQ
jgi:uncharacterized protein YndB with AHSA1/START domain